MQQEPSAETTEGTGITINCSHPNIQTADSIHWYRQLPGRGPAFIALALKGSKVLQDPPGRLSVAPDRRSSTLRLAQPRLGDAAVYYCAVGDTARGAGAAAGHEAARAGPGVCVGGGGQPRAGPPGGAAAPPGPGPLPPTDRYQHRPQHRCCHRHRARRGPAAPAPRSLDPSLSLSLPLPLNIPTQSPHTLPLHLVSSLIPLQAETPLSF